MSAYVYILQSASGKYYVGSTNNLKRRLRQHLNDHTYTTRRMESLRLVLYQEYENILSARKIERRVKCLKRRDYIDKMVKEGRINLKL